MKHDRRTCIHTKLKVRMIDLIRPPHGFCYRSADVAMEIFRWMVATGKPYDGVWAVLSKQGTCGPFAAVTPFVDATTWRADLHERFLHALLDRGCAKPVNQWRDRFGISVNSVRWIPVSYSAAHHVHPVTWGDEYLSTEDIIYGMLRERGKLIEAHNECHPRARSVFRVRLEALPRGWVASAIYGYESDRKFGSSWSIEIAAQEEDELFCDFVSRAGNRLAKLVGKTTLL